MRYEMGVLTTALMFLSVTAAVTNEQDYLRRKWREDLSDPKTGLEGATLKTNLAERVETWRKQESWDEGAASRELEGDRLLQGAGNCHRRRFEVGIGNKIPLLRLNAKQVRCL